MDRIEINRNFSPEMQISEAQLAGLTLCPRCAVNFTDGSFCAPCQEIIEITMHRINVGIDEDRERRIRNRRAGFWLQLLFWFAFGSLIAYIQWR